MEVIRHKMKTVLLILSCIAVSTANIGKDWYDEKLPSMIRKDSLTSLITGDWIWISIFGGGVGFVSFSPETEGLTRAIQFRTGSDGRLFYATFKNDTL